MKVIWYPFLCLDGARCRDKARCMDTARELGLARDRRRVVAEHTARAVVGRFCALTSAEF